jgi:ABC-2 type transport system ATP-binding protein
MTSPGRLDEGHVLRAHHLSKRLAAVHILDDISFSLHPGEILGLIGPNGAGKTTLLECVAGLLPLDDGTLRWQGRPLSLPGRKRVFWYQPDHCEPFAWQRVGATLSFFRQAHNQSETRLWQLIKQLDLTPVLGKPYATLSKGYGRRILLTLALLSRRPLLLLDEPFDGFDPRQVRLAVNLLRQERQNRGLLLSIHQLAEAEKICDRFLLLAEGKKLACGTLPELRDQAGLKADATLEEVFLALT